MVQNKREVVTNVFCDVIETMAFMFADPIEKEDFEDLPADAIQADMSYIGENKGNVTIIIPSEIGMEISANVLGKDTDEAMKMVKALDSIKELLNIFTGRLLTELYGEGPVYDLTPPEAVCQDESIWETVKNSDDYYLYLVDEWYVAIKIEQVND